MRTLIYKIHAIALCFIMGTALSFSQNTNTDWTVDSYLVTINNTTDVELTSHLIKEGTDITWEQIGYNHSDTTVFNITASSGTWDTQNHLGELSYDLVVESSTITASLIVSGTTDGITITLTIDVSSTAADTYLFDIDMDTLTNL